VFLCSAGFGVVFGLETERLGEAFSFLDKVFGAAFGVYYFIGRLLYFGGDISNY
jgi:hypothetical protein